MVTTLEQLFKRGLAFGVAVRMPLGTPVTYIERLGFRPGSVSTLSLGSVFTLKAAGSDSNTWLSTTCRENSDWVLGSWLQPNPAWAVLHIWGVNRTSLFSLVLNKKRERKIVLCRDIWKTLNRDDLSMTPAVAQECDLWFPIEHRHLGQMIVFRDSRGY